MIELRSKTIKWFNQRTPGQKWALFLGGFVVLYLLYFVLFLYPLSSARKELIKKIDELTAQKNSIDQQIENIKNTVHTPVFMQMYQKQKQLSAQLVRMQQTIDSLKTDLFTSESLSKITKNILSEQRNMAALISLQELPVLPWSAQGSAGYQHILKLEFKNDFFNTMTYLQRLESISQHIYWDNFNYKVEQYPKALVTVKFHVLSLEKN